MKFTDAEYDSCTFSNCNFSNVDISNTVFLECAFIDCDISMAKVTKDVQFVNCKMLGLNFNDCNKFLFAVDFINYPLNLYLFYQLTLKTSKFKDSNLQEVDFTESNLTGVSFNKSNSSRAIFDKSILEKTDIGTAYNYSIDPDSNLIKRAKFSKSGIEG